MKTQQLQAPLLDPNILMLRIEILLHIPLFQGCRSVLLTLELSMDKTALLGKHGGTLCCPGPHFWIPGLGNIWGSLPESSQTSGGRDQVLFLDSVPGSSTYLSLGQETTEAALGIRDALTWGRDQREGKDPGIYPSVSQNPNQPRLHTPNLPSLWSPGL